MNWIGLVVCISVLAHSLASAQMVPYITKDEFDWKTWESIKDEGSKKELIAQAENFTDLPDPGSSPEERYRHFKAIDIDADGNPDLVYNGPLAGDSAAVVFYLNNEGRFRKIFHQTGDLIYVSRDKPWNPISFQIVKNAGPDNSELQICSHSFKDGQLQFVLDNTIIIRDGMRVIQENLPPMLFEVDEEIIPLRTSPEIQADNVIQDYVGGELGFAVGSEMNSDGEIWWFVLMKESESKLRAGWINSSAVKRL